MAVKKEVQEGYESVRDGAKSAVKDARDGLQDVAEQSCSYIKDNPWAGIGAGAVVGLLVGFLIGKK